MHNPEWRIYAFEDEEEGQYLDENCFKNEINYINFKKYYEPLKSLPLFNKIKAIIEESTKVSYCFTEKDEDDPRLKDALGSAEPLVLNIDYITNLGFRNIKTNEYVTYKDYISGYDKSILGQPEQWKGVIGLDRSKINSKTIFHELNHAAQFFIAQTENVKYSEATMEVETRMILFYSAFLKADVTTRKNREKMFSYIELNYGKGMSYDLYPLVGYFPNTPESKNAYYCGVDVLGYNTIDDRYKLIYDYFSHLKDDSNDYADDFHILMKDYANWLVQVWGYKYDYSLFNPRYYLLLKIK